MAEVAPPIREPGVDFFVTIAPTIERTPPAGMTPFVVAPHFQVMRERDSDGNFLAEALVGTYQNLDATITYALPGIKPGAVLMDDSVALFLKVGQQEEELDSPDDETEVVNSTGTLVQDVALDTHELTDAAQNFTSSGVLANQDPSGADYVVRMEGTDGLVHDFPVTAVAPGSNVTKVRVGNDPNEGVKPSSGSQAYQIILNPRKFIVNADAIKSSLRVNSAAATRTIGAGDAAVRVTANQAGAEGNGISYAQTDKGSGGVSVVTVVDLAISVAVTTDATTAEDIVNLVNAHAVASQLVTADSPGTGGSSPTLGAAANLTGGSHIVFEAPTGGVAGNLKRVKYSLATNPGDPLSFSLSGQDLTVRLKNTGGSPASTDAEIATAITSTLDPSYLAAVDTFINATAFGGSGVPVVAALSVFTALSGGYQANSVTVDANLLGSSLITGKLYVYYKALRREFTALASTTGSNPTGNDPTMAVISSQQELATLVGEATEENPLGLMMDLARRNNPGGLIYGLGVDTVSDNEPDGTLEAWSRAADFMTGKTPYFGAFASQRKEIREIWYAHTDFMNGDGDTEPAIMERYIFANPPIPLSTPDELIVSGDGMDRTASGEFTASENFDLALVQAGDVLVLNGGDVDDNADVVLQDGTHGYELSGVKSGDSFTVETVGAGAASLSNADYQIFRPGESLVVGDDFDRQGIAEAINIQNQQVKRAAVALTFPDNCTISIGGELKGLPGYYADAAQVGQCAAQKMSQPKTQQPLLGIESVRLSSDFFSDPQLAIIQGGGTWTRHQPIQGGAVVTRVSLSSDVSNTNKKNPTATWQIHQFCRIVRAVIKPTLSAVITLSLLDEITAKTGAVGKALKDRQELARQPKLDEVRQGNGTDAPIDNVILRGEASPLQPNNGVKFYLAVTP